MDDITYEDFVKLKMKSGALLLEQTNSKKLELEHMALGVAGEAGEIVDAIKKHTCYNKEIDVKHVIEEVGDMLFYLTGIANILGFDLDDAVEANIAKLNKRYAQSFTDAEASARADKV